MPHKTTTRNNVKVSDMSEERPPARETYPTPEQWAKTPAAKRAAEAARLRMGGYGYQEIADLLGYANHSGAYKATQKALVEAADKRAEPLDMLRVMENARLDTLIKRALEVMNARHYATNNQGVIYAPTSASDYVRHPDTDAIMRDDNGHPVVTHLEPLADDAPALDAIKTVLKIMERKAKMNGLDAPTRREVITLDAIEAEIERLEASMQSGA